MNLPLTKPRVASVAHQMKMTAQLIMEGLGTGMYVDIHACMWEIIRNAACSHMPDPKVWTPGIGQADISLVTDFPMFRGIKTLIVRDYGRGFTEDDMNRFCYLGTPSSHLRKYPGGTYGGASQKGMGRLAAFGLNKLSVEEGDTSTGFYVLTRTTKNGPVRFISVIPDEIMAHQSISSVFLEEDSSDLGFLQNVRGSFTAVIIPYSMYDNVDQIKEGIKWRLPRQAEQSFKLFVQGKRVLPPLLADKINFADPSGKIRLCADVKSKDSEHDGGLWITDLRTGLRVVDATNLVAHLPHPFGSREIIGDLFIEGVLGNQDSSRAGLRSEYLKSIFWRKVLVPYLLLISKEVLALLGQEEGGKQSQFKTTVTDIFAVFSRAWGNPVTGGIENLFGDDKSDSGDNPPDKAEGKERGGQGAPRTRGKSDPPSSSGAVVKKRTKVQNTAIRIDGQDYSVRFSGDQEYVFGTVTENIIELNPQCSGIPARKEPRSEYILNALLTAVARSKGLEGRKCDQWVHARRKELPGV